MSCGRLFYKLEKTLRLKSRFSYKYTMRHHVIEIKEFSKLSCSEIEEFFDSFDIFLFDCDGVFRNMREFFPEADKPIHMLQEMGKQIKIVTNNTLHTTKSIWNSLKSKNIDIELADVYTPTTATIDYLRNIHFNKKIYLMPMIGMRKDLEEAEFQISNSPEPEQIELTFEGFLKSFDRPKDVGAVVTGINFNLSLGMMNKTLLYLKDPNVLYIATGLDSLLPNFDGEYFIGAGILQEMFNRESNRTPVGLGKPSSDFHQYLKKSIKFDPNRTIFIGDCLQQDIAFGKLMGMKTMLVLSGKTTKKEMESCDKCCRPDYYANSIVDLYKYR